MTNETRRSLLGKTATLMGGAVLGRLVRPTHATAQETSFPPGVPEWSRMQGAPILTHPYGLPSRFEKNVIRRAVPDRPTQTAATSLTPLQDLHGIITPNGLVYERHHAGVPDIDPEQHRLLVHGLVERPLIFRMSDLMRFPQVSRLHFLECSGNTQTWKPGSPSLTVQDTHGLVSCCEWTGVMLSTVLDEVGIKKEATWLLAESADAAGMDRSVPMAKALDDAMLVYSQNGERLRPEQGYPLRLFLPGYEGNMSIKWLRRIKLGTEPFETREETSKYTDLMPDGSARQFTFLMEAKSVITQPSGGQRLTEQGFYEISRPRLVGPRQDPRGRRLDRWRRQLARGGAAGTGAVEMPDALPPPLALGRRSGAIAEPRHRRDRLYPAQEPRAGGSARHQLLLPL